VKALPSVPPLPSGVTQSIDPYKWGPQEAAINTWFDSNIVR
jgi:iron(III) transport system substrate-binding protein